MNAADIETARAKAVTIATRVLAGLQSPLVAARELNRLRFSIDLPDDDPDFLAFVGIESETDALPVGPARKHWAPDALAAKADEIARAEEWALKIGEDAFRSVVARFGRAV